MFNSLMILLLAGPAQPPDKPDSISKAEAEESRAVAKKRLGPVRLPARQGIPGRTETRGRAGVPVDPGARAPLLRGHLRLDEGRPARGRRLNHLRLRGAEPDGDGDSLALDRPAGHGLERQEDVGAGSIGRGVQGGAGRTPKPAATALARLQQMRALAAQFSVHGDYGSQKWDLRLLRTPAYRYECADQKVLDGALFIFSQGELTDPETFLMLEARGKEPQWQFALVRFNGNCSLRALHRDMEVWKVERLPIQVNLDPKKAYFAIRSDR